jgi:hypothetical protein
MSTIVKNDLVRFKDNSHINNQALFKVIKVKEDRIRIFLISLNKGKWIDSSEVEYVGKFL